MSGPRPMNLILIWTAGPCLELKELEDVLLTTAHPKRTHTHTPTFLRNNQSKGKGSMLLSQLTYCFWEEFLRFQFDKCALLSKIKSF